MQGIKLLTHSIGMVLSNWKAVLQIWALPMLICGAVIVAAFAALGPSFRDQMQFKLNSGDPGFTSALPIVLTGILVIWVCVLWGIVAWHRFVLNDEPPRGFVPPFHGKNMLGYLGQTVLIALILLVPGYILSIASVRLMIMSMQSGTGFLIFNYVSPVLNAILTTAFVCMSPAMVGRALGEKTTIGGAIRAISWKGIGQIFLCVAIGLLAVWLIQMGLERLIEVTPTFGSILDVLFGLIRGLVQICILTTVYGHYLEKRPLA